MGRPRNAISLSPTYDKLMQPSNSPAAVARRTGAACAECGGEHVLPNGKPSCDGHNALGKPCGNKAIRGGFVCSQRHGGAAPQVRRAANQRLEYIAAEGDVARLLREVDVPGGIHPLDGLLEVVRHTGQMMRLLGGLTGQLDADPATTWITVTVGKDAHREIRSTTNDALTGYDDRGNQAPDVRLELYGRWARLYMDACKTALAADIDERLVRNSTTTADTFFRAVKVALSAAGVTQEQHDAFIQAAAAELRKLGALSALMPS